MMLSQREPVCTQDLGEEVCESSLSFARSRAPLFNLVQSLLAPWTTDLPCDRMAGHPCRRARESGRRTGPRGVP